MKRVIFFYSITMGLVELQAHPYKEAFETITTPGGETFFDAINMPRLKEVVTPKHPWALVSMGAYLQELGLRDSGGLEILMGDMILQAKRLGIPLVGLTLIYPQRNKAMLDDNFYQQDIPEYASPEERNYEQVGKTTIKANGDVVNLGIYKVGDFPIYGLSEPGLGPIYAGTTDSDHRMYQQAVLGFGGFQALKELGLDPSVWHLNESSAVFASIPMLDDYCTQGQSVDEAFESARAKTILTNHTLVAAAVGSISRRQSQDYVFNNIVSEELRHTLQEQIGCQGDSCNLSVMSTSLVGKSNGVSKLHAELASGRFIRFDGTPVQFDPITNSIFMGRWVDPRLLALYRRGAVTDFDLPTGNYQREINRLDSEELIEIKNQARRELRISLRERLNQYGEPIVNISDDAILVCWAKRFAGYKRPGMIFEDLTQLKEIFQDNNVHVLMSGKAHSEDISSKLEIQRIMRLVDGDEVLRRRVHFVQDYDEKLARYLVAGVDIWFNTPEIGKEACGTSWMKAVGNLAMLISTEDGGVADMGNEYYLRIDEGDYATEVRSLYQRFREAMQILENKGLKGYLMKKQLMGSLPIIAGGRMWKDYIYLVYPHLVDK